jgi:hypothetical protein
LRALPIVAPLRWFLCRPVFCVKECAVTWQPVDDLAGLDALDRELASDMDDNSAIGPDDVRHELPPTAKALPQVRRDSAATMPAPPHLEGVKTINSDRDH